MRGFQISARWQACGGMCKKRKDFKDSGEIKDIQDKATVFKLLTLQSLFFLAFHRFIFSGSSSSAPPWRRMWG